MSTAQNSQSSFGEYDENILQVSDTEDNGIDYDEIAGRYDEGDVDLIQFAGDGSKKTGMNPDDYLEQLEDTYDVLDKLGRDLGAEVAVLPGNHEPIKDAHAPKGEPKDQEYVEQVEALLEEQYDDFSEFEGNAYEFLVDTKYDNITNLEFDSIELEGLTVVGGTHHIEEETAREFLDSEPGLEDLGYDAEKLSEEITVEKPYEGIFSKIPYVGDWISNYFSTEENPKPSEIELGDIPEDYELTDEHEDYLEAVDMFDDLEEMVLEAENDVYLAHHGAPSSMVNRWGSTVVDKLTEKHSDKIALVGGGHTGEAMMDDIYGTAAVNTNNGYATEIGLQNGEVTHQEAYDPTVEGIESKASGDQIDEKQIEEMAQSIPDEMIEERTDVEEFMNQTGISDREEAINELKKGMVFQNMQQQNQTQQASA